MRRLSDFLPLFLTLTVAALWRFAWLDLLPLTGTEAYLWQQSQHPAFAYVEGPGGNALLLRAGLQMLNRPPGEGVIRTTHAAVGVIAVLCTYLAGASLFSGPVGVLAATLIALGTPFVLDSRHLSSATPQLALIMLALALIAPLWRTERFIPPWRILLGGLVMALACFCGYEGFLLLPAVILSVALTRPSRLRQGPLWMFGTLSLIGVAPWLFWNYAHGYIGLHHLASLWATRAPLSTQATILLDYIGIPVTLMGALACLGLRHALPRALLVLATTLLIGALVWPQSIPMATCGTGLAILAFAQGLHCWAKTTLPREREWFPLRFLVPTIVITLTGMAAYDAINQTWAPAKGILYRAASESIYQECAPWFGFPRVRTAPWRHHLPTFEPGPWIVLEDRLAAQMAYYMDVPVYGVREQYRLWEIPALQQANIVADLQIDRGELTYQLRQHFTYVQGPTGRFLLEKDASPYVIVWYVSGPREEPTHLLEHYARLRTILYPTKPITFP